MNKTAPEDLSKRIESFITYTTSFLLKELPLSGWPREFKEILQDRITIELQEHFILMGELKRKASNSLLKSLESIDNWLDIAKRIRLSVLRRFDKEFEDFRKKYKEKYIDTIQKAKNGNITSMCRLVEWDKTWVCMPFMRKIIAHKQHNGDKLFFEMIGTAFSKKSKLNMLVKKEKDIFTTTKLLSKFVDIGKKGNIKKLQDLLAKIYEDKKSSPLLADDLYFAKWLRRHKIKQDTKT